MKKNNNKKGFTVVELVIVISVIAILAAVLIPTFSGVISKANDSKALQEARNTYTNYLAEFNYATGGTPEKDLVVQVGSRYFAVDDGELESTDYTTANDAAKDGAGLAADTTYTIIEKGTSTVTVTQGTVSGS